ncbi:glycosyltransferase [Candidatus Woesearchaeota archaeon]|nr:glycosyltransferase [Candidatus Woesearchaeota archaeon]
MKVLMLGWEFPPFFAGGLGVVCYEMTKVFARRPDIDELIYLMPYGPRDGKSHISLKGANQVIQEYKEKLSKEQQAIVNKITFKFVPTILSSPYMTPEEYKNRYEEMKEKINFNSLKWQDLNALNEELTEMNYYDQKNAKDILYGRNIFEEVFKFAKRVAYITKNLDFDVIHAHDWMTMPAAIAAKKMSGKPLVVHIHNTIYDRYLGTGGFDEKELEIQGMQEADKVIAISNLVKNHLVHKYMIPESKIEVIHNGSTDLDETRYNAKEIFKNKKIILFAGRVTMQKGGEYFVKAAAKVIKYCPDTVFVVAGSGDALGKMIDLAAELDVLKYFYFHGFYTLQERDIFFGMADLFVMPSVSEPFGVVPLEAMAKKTPTIVSYQSGVSEILQNTFKVDFWDIDKLAEKIICLLKYVNMHNQISEQGYLECKSKTWDEPVDKMIKIYKNLQEDCS